MAETKIDAMLALRSTGRAAVDRGRIRLLEAVAATGSITKAAQAVGLSYKGAWDALNAINNLLPRPAVTTQTGGRHGGGARVTEDGHALIAAFDLLETRLARAAALLADDAGSIADPLTLLRSLSMKTSARNAFRGTVVEIRPGSVNSEILLRLTDSVSLAAVITSASMRELDVQVGGELTALIKASFIMLASGEAPPAVSARNRIPGIVSHREDGPVSSEITLDIGAGKTLTAVATREGVDHWPLAPGDRAWALFKASHVILAAD